MRATLDVNGYSSIWLVNWWAAFLFGLEAAIVESQLCQPMLSLEQSLPVVWLQLYTAIYSELIIWASHELWGWYFFAGLEQEEKDRDIVEY